MSSTLTTTNLSTPAPMPPAMPFSLGKRRYIGVWPLLEPGARASAGARLLAAHAVATRAALARAVAATLARLRGAPFKGTTCAGAGAPHPPRGPRDAGFSRAPPPRAAARTREPASAERDAERFCVRRCRRCRERGRRKDRSALFGSSSNEKSENDARLFPTLFEDNVRRDVARGAWDARAASAPREDVGGTPPEPMSSMASRESHGSVLAHRARLRGGAASPSPAGVDAGPPRTKDPNLNACGSTPDAPGTRTRGRVRRAETARTVVETPHGRHGERRHRVFYVIERTTGAPRDSNGARGRAIGVKDGVHTKKRRFFRPPRHLVLPR